MKNEKFLRGVGEIDDRILQRYDEIEQRMAKPNPKHTYLIRWASLAACLCIIFTSVFFLQRKNGNDEVKDGNDGNNEVPSVDVGGFNQVSSQTTNDFRADVLPSFPPPIFETKSADEYENFAQSKELPFTLFSINAFECFGTFNGFETYGIDSRSDFVLTYLYKFEQMDTKVSVGSKENYFSNEEYLSSYGDIYIEETDMPENLCINPELYWLRNSEDERVFEAYLEKYNIGSGNRYIHFRVTENVILRYWNWEREMIPTVIFWFDDYVMELSFGPGYSIMEKYNLVGVTPTVKDLLTKSTAQETAEELYNLWKDALK